MPAVLLDGIARAAEIRAELRDALSSEWLRDRRVRLVSLGVGDDPAGALYLAGLSRACSELGIEFAPRTLPAACDEEEVVARILELNADPAVTGVLLQRPLPPSFNGRRLQAKVHPDKDVEGMNPANVGQIVFGTPRLAPATALAAIDLARLSGVPFKGRDAVVVGHSEIVGKPIAFLLLNEFCTTTICHVETRDLGAKTREADFVFVAVGKPGLLRGDMVKRGAVVLDIGIRRVEGRDGERRTVGDVDVASVREVAGWLTPVPGGVGPVTVAMLLRNAVRAALDQETRGDP